MSKLWIPFSLLIAALGQAQVKLMIYAHDEELGNVVINQRLTEDGSKRIEIMMLINKDGQKVYLKNRTEYLPNGAPKRMFQAMSIGGSSKRRQTSVEFDEAGAHASRDGGQGWKQRSIPLGVSQPKESSNEFWFLRDQPTVGQTVKAFVFDLEKLAWEMRISTYKGKEQITVHGKTYEAHHVATQHNGKPVDAYMDNAGRPIRIVEGETTMERVEK